MNEDLVERIAAVMRGQHGNIVFETLGTRPDLDGLVLICRCGETFSSRSRERLRRDHEDHALKDSVAQLNRPKLESDLR